MTKSQILLKKTAFCPIKIFCEKRDGHSKRERKKIIALHQNAFLQEPPQISQMAFFR